MNYFVHSKFSSMFYYMSVKGLEKKLFSIIYSYSSIELSAKGEGSDKPSSVYYSEKDSSVRDEFSLKEIPGFNALFTTVLVYLFC